MAGPLRLHGPRPGRPPSRRAMAVKVIKASAEFGIPLEKDRAAGLAGNVGQVPEVGCEDSAR